jgi:hypothetical protein
MRPGRCLARMYLRRSSARSPLDGRGRRLRHPGYAKSDVIAEARKVVKVNREELRGDADCADSIQNCRASRLFCFGDQRFPHLDPTRIRLPAQHDLDLTVPARNFGFSEFQMSWPRLLKR